MGHDKHKRPHLAMRYSFDEIKTDQTWVDGKPIFRKVIDFGVLPNTASKNVAHGISNLEFVKKLRGMSLNAVTPIFITIPWVNSASDDASVVVIGDDVRITTSSAMDQWTETYVIIEYTKS